MHNMAARTIPLSLLLNSESHMGHSESADGHSSSQPVNIEQSPTEQGNEQSNLEQEYLEETSTEEDTSSVEEEGLFMLGVAARMTELMQGEEEGNETLEILQHENNKLRTHLIQRSCGRGGSGHADDALYAYWLRQETRLERIRVLLSKIRSHRSAICRIVGVEEHGDTEGVSQQRS